MLTATAQQIERFMTKVIKRRSGCWEWQGARSRGGGNSLWYGSFRCGSKVVRAHRFSSEVFNKDECPKGYHRDHTCNNSLCVNPDHIEVVTHEENQRREEARRATVDEPSKRKVSSDNSRSAVRKKGSRFGSAKDVGAERKPTKRRSHLVREKHKGNRVLKRERSSTVR